MTFEYLKYFIKAYECGSIQIAAKNLFVSPQGLGKSIQRLENSLGIKLLERAPTGVTPTAFGKVFYEQAVRADTELTKLTELAQDYIKSQKQKIVIGTIGKTNFIFGLSLCAEKYRQLHPDSQIEMEIRQFDRADDLYDSLENGSVHIASMFHWRDHPKMKYFTYSDYSPIFLLVSKSNALAEKSYVTWEDIRDLRIITPNEVDSFTHLIKDLGKRSGVNILTDLNTTENRMVAILLDKDIAGILLREPYTQVILESCRNSVKIPLKPEIKVANSLLIPKNSQSSKEVREFAEFAFDYMKRNFDY